MISYEFIMKVELDRNCSKSRICSKFVKIFRGEYFFIKSINKLSLIATNSEFSCFS
jgi:hypothetical protein